MAVVQFPESAPLIYHGITSFLFLLEKTLVISLRIKIFNFHVKLMVDARQVKGLGAG